MHTETPLADRLNTNTINDDLKSKAVALTDI